MEELTEIQKKQIKIMDHYGEDRQLEKLVEECAELIKAIDALMGGRESEAETSDI